MIDSCSQATNCAIINIDAKMLILIITAICLNRQFGFELRQRLRLRSTRSQSYQYHQREEFEEILMNFLQEIILMFVTDLAFGIRK